METLRDEPRVTVVTPTYNRAHTLGRVYESLLAQTAQNFEWVIVDDGSDDGTDALVGTWEQVGGMRITYLRKENAGKHVAINRGVEIARGEFITIIDSDDWFVADALETLLCSWGTIPVDQQDRFSGVVGLCAYEDGSIVGDVFPHDPLDCDPAELSYVYEVAGDKHSLLQTSVLRRFPFPEAPRSYVPEALVWNRMALTYSERHINVVVKIVDYQEGGLSDRSLELQIRTPLPMRQFYLEELRLPHRLTLRRRFRSYANYVRFSLHAGIGMPKQAGTVPSKIAWLLVVPVGAALYLRDRGRFGVSQSLRG